VHQPGRNDPCPCGSGKKYKRCCLGRPDVPTAHTPVPATLPPCASAQPLVFLDEIDQISNRAIDLIEAGRLEEAEAVCQRLLAEFPDMPDGLMRTAALHKARGQRREAAECYRKAADLQLRNDPQSGHDFAADLRAQADRLDAGAPGGEPPAATDPS
jgi:tetratricopeptide (TPR) repeat protein